MEILINEIELHLKHKFTTAHESKKSVKRVIVKIADGEIYGLGEAAPNSRYNESVESVCNFINEIRKLNFEDKSFYESINMINAMNGNFSAKSALDIALFDIHTKKLNLPLWKYFGLYPHHNLTTSYTIGIDTIENIENKIAESEKFNILKVKLGCKEDKNIIKTIRKFTDKPLRVDVNEGWGDLNIAIDMIKFLEDHNVELIEQPMPSSMLFDYNRLRERSSIPIIADESCKTFEDLLKICEYFDGVNIKLSKCGGISNAYLMIQTAHNLNLKVMLGCMVESSVGISAAAQLAPMVDYIDLDGNLLISNDPYLGVQLINGNILLNNEPGIGVKEKSNE